MFIHIPGLRVQFIEKISLLRIQWDVNWHQLHEFRGALRAVAQMVGEQRIRQFVIDMNGLPSLSLDDQLWLGTQWLPEVSSHGAELVALVLPTTNMYNQMVVEGLIRASRHFIDYDIQFFSDPVEGLDWLISDYPEQIEKMEGEWNARFGVLSRVAVKV